MKNTCYKILIALFVVSLAGVTACGGEEPPAATADTEETYGEEAPVADPMAAEGAVDETMGEEPIEGEATEGEAAEGEAAEGEGEATGDEAVE